MTKLTFSIFVDQINLKLKSCNKDDLKQIIINIGKNVSPNDRDQFLLKLSPILKSNHQIKRQEVLNEMNIFLDDIKNGDYFYGYGWDSERYEERAFGDEEWIPKFNDYLEHSNGYYNEKEFDVAKNFYQILIEVLDHEADGEYLPSADESNYALDLDEEELVAKFMYSQYLTDEPSKRVSTLLKSIENSWFIKTHFSFKQMLEVTNEELPQISSFFQDLRLLIEQKKGKDKLESHFPYLNANFISEVYFYSQGKEGLEKLARNMGSHNPRYILKLLSYLEQEGDTQKIIETTIDALEFIPLDMALRSNIAEYLIRIGRENQNLSLELQGNLEAMFSNPSLKYLLSIFNLSKDKDELIKIFPDVIKRLKELVNRPRKGVDNVDTIQSSASKLLLCQTLVLSNRINEAFNLCKNDKVLGWTYSDIPSKFFIPFLLKLLMENNQSQSIDRIFNEWVNPNSEQEINKDFISILNFIIQNTQLTSKSTEIYTSWLEIKITERVDLIVANKYRKSYYKAAELLVALSDIYSGKNNKTKSNKILEVFKAKYKRHSAFQKEIKKLL